MANKVRISKNPAIFDDYMSRTDELQKSTDPITSLKKYLGWGWKDEESTQWTAFRNESNALYAEYSNPDKTNHAATVKMNELVSKVRAYDNNKSTGHQLLDKISINGSVDDCITFNIVRGTVMQADPVRSADDPTDFVPDLKFKNNTVGQHVIMVTCSGTNDTKLPEGMAFAQIFRCISATKPTKLNQYELVGTAKYGIFKSNFGEIVPGENEVLFAYYYGRYMSKKGVLGNPGDVIDAPLMLAKP